MSIYQQQRIMTVFHYYNMGAAIPSVSGDAELINLGSQVVINLIEDAGAGLRLNTVNTFEWQYARVQVVAPARGYYVTSTAGVAGLLAVAGIPSNTHATVAFRTAAVGRGKTGNKKITGLALTTIEDNYFKPPIVEFLNEWALLVMAPRININGDDQWQPTVWSPRRAADRRDIVSRTTDNTVNVLRRRTLRVGI